MRVVMLTFCGPLLARRFVLGKGCVFSFDPVGSYEREVCRAAGSASSLLQPLLDNQFGFKNQEGHNQVPLTKVRGIVLA